MMPVRQFLVRFEPNGKSAAVSPGASLLDAARRAGINLAANCSGQGDCGLCGVFIREGEVSALTEEEEQCLQAHEIQENYRLACCTRVYSAARVLIPEIKKRVPAP
jgi:ferredoxin